MQTPKTDDKKKALQILVPAVAVAGVVALIGLMLSIGNTPPPTTAAGKPGETAAGKFELFPLDGAGWKDIGEGLKVWDVKEGSGDPCPATARVNVHYSGWLTTGKKFDSSLDRGKPIEFPLDGVIAGWTKGIPGMKIGGTRRLYIPWAMAYGANGRGDIPPKADLIFEVEMLGFQ
jgi:FKBP-type peptidyl-prolyl cis-trans isomerase